MTDKELIDYLMKQIRSIDYIMSRQIFYLTVKIYI